MRARLVAFAPLFPLVLLAVSLALSSLVAAGPCPPPDSGGC
jgi:hypothetical protein